MSYEVQLPKYALGTECLISLKTYIAWFLLESLKFNIFKNITYVIYAIFCYRRCESIIDGEVDTEDSLHKVKDHVLKVDSYKSEFFPSSKHYW